MYTSKHIVILFICTEFEWIEQCYNCLMCVYVCHRTEFNAHFFMLIHQSKLYFFFWLSFNSHNNSMSI